MDQPCHGFPGVTLGWRCHATHGLPFARQLARPGRVPGQTPAEVIAGGLCLAACVVGNFEGIFGPQKSSEHKMMFQLPTDE